MRNRMLCVSLWMSMALMWILANRTLNSKAVNSLPVPTKVEFQLPIQWTAFRIPDLYPRRKPFLFYGPYSFAVSDKGILYVPDDKRNVIVEIDFKGKVLRYLPPEGVGGAISDIVYSNGRLYCGRADEPRIIVIDVKKNSVISDIVLKGKNKPLSTWSPHWWQLPVISRLGVDKQGNIHAVICQMHGIEQEYEKICIDQKGKIIDKIVVQFSRIDGKLELLDSGVVSPDGDWTYIIDNSLPIDKEGTYIFQHQLAQYSLNGVKQVLDPLSNLLGGYPGSILDIIGYDTAGTLWAMVELLYPHPRFRRWEEAYLVSWKGTERRIHGRVMAKPGNIRAPGSRHAVLDPKGNIYMLVATSEPESPGEKVKLQLVRIQP